MQQNQMAGLSLQPPIKTISVLVVHLLIAHSCRAQVQLIGPLQPIVVTVGDEVILPCHLNSAVNVAAKTLEWTRPDLIPRFVYVWRAGQDLENVKNPSYSGRTSLFANELKRGNISLKLSNVKPSDAGKYRCFIPAMNTDAVVELVVASDAVSSPVIALKGIDRDKDGVVLQCESVGWYPEPEVLWLDGEGNLLSAGPTETVRGPDDLYTVSSRVTVEKRHSNSFTCRVQQKDTNQMRKTHIQISDDFFNTQSSSAPIIIGLAVSLAVWILFVLLLIVFVWKWRQNIIKTRRSHRDETVKGEEKNRSNTKKSDNQFVTGEERKPLKEKEENTTKHFSWRKITKQTLEDEQQKRETAEEHFQTLTQELQALKNKEDYNRTVPASLGSVQGSISVDEVDLNGSFVRLSNNSEQDQPMGDWELHLQVNTRKPIKYQFKHWFKFKAGSTVTIWASGCGKWSETSTELLWFSQETWGTGRQLLINLYSNTGELKVREALELDISQTKYQKINSCLTSPDFAKGHIVVDEADLGGNYVRLRNNSNKNQQLMEWELHIHVNNRKPIIYTFRNSFTLKPANTVAIWSKDHSARNDPHTNLVWVSQKLWGTGEQLLFNLYSNTGELEARKILEPEESQSITKETESQEKGTIIVEDVDLLGKCVVLNNKSDKVQQLRGWTLHIQVNNSKTNIYTLDDCSLEPETLVPVKFKQTTWDAEDQLNAVNQLQVILYSNTGEKIFMSEYNPRPPPAKKFFQLKTSSP